MSTIPTDYSQVNQLFATWKHALDERDATISQLQAEIARYRETLQWIADGYEADAHASRTCARRARAALGGSNDQ